MHTARLVLLAAVALSPALPAAVSAGGTAVRLQVSATVATVLRLRTVGHPASVEVTAQDVERGEVAVRGGLLDLFVNHREGFVLHGELVGGAFGEFELRGLPRDLRSEGTVASWPMPMMARRAPWAVEYRLRLRPETRPGSYPWPIVLSLRIA